MMKLNLDKSWKKVLKKELKKEYFVDLITFVEQEYKTNTIFPPKEKLFEAYNLSTFDNIKVVILGQDPYHGIGQAHGLCFSVNDGIKFPPSLRNIFKELKNDLDLEIPVYGNLSKWAEQGVLLINAIHTVKESQAGSHQKKGWEMFTDSVIKLISTEKDNVVFILWGAFAQKKEELIDTEKHLILKSVHPSPLSASRGFFNNNHFSKTNDYLLSKSLDPIDWKLDY